MFTSFHPQHQIDKKQLKLCIVKLFGGRVSKAHEIGKDAETQDM